MSDTNYCKDCKNINCPEGRVNCKYPDAIACDLYRDAPPSLFDCITASPEVLAPHFVYYDQDEYPAVTTIDGKEVELRWRSMICKERYYETKEQAIAATVTKLKEVKDE